MNIVNSFLTIEQLLSDYYFSTNKYYDDLGAMLGDINTQIWKPNKALGEEIVSGDPAIFEDNWSDAWNKIVGEGKDGILEQVFKVAKILLDYYIKDVEYDLGDAEAYLKKELLG